MAEHPVEAVTSVPWRFETFLVANAVQVFVQDAVTGLILTEKKICGHWFLPFFEA